MDLREINQELALNTLIRMEEKGKNIDEALSILAAGGSYSPKYAIYEWCRVTDGDRVRRQLSKNPIDEGFSTYEAALAYLRTRYGSEDNSLRYKIVRYA